MNSKNALTVRQSITLWMMLLVFIAVLFLRCSRSGSDGSVSGLSCGDGLKVVAQDKTLDVEGTVHVSAIMPEDMSYSRFQYLLEEKSGTKHELQFKGKAPGFRTGDKIRISGKIDKSRAWSQEAGAEFNDSIIVESVTSVAGMRAMSFPYSLGAQSTLAILVSFSDLATSYTQAGAQDVVFNQVDSFWREASFGKTWVTGKAVGPYTISMSSGSCSTSTMASLAKAAAQAAGENLSSYSRFVYIFPRATACGTWVGLADVGGSTSGAWINGAMTMHTIGHEMGHNLGMYHANAWDCGTSASIGSSCSSIEYGDPGDTMGTMIPAHYNAYHKEQLGWLSPSSGITQVSASGVFSIEPFETNTTGVKALKILKSNDTGGHTYYYVEYRQPVGVDSNFTSLSNSNLTSGVMIHTGTDYDDNTSYLINMNPAKGSWEQAALNTGEVFTDSSANVAITLDSVSSAGAQVSVSINGAPVPNPTPNPNGGGTIAVSLSSTTISTGQVLDANLNSSTASAAYTVTVTGPDGFKLVKTGTTDSLGNGVEHFQAGSCAAKGTYTVSVVLTGGSNPSTAQFILN